MIFWDKRAVIFGFLASKIPLALELMNILKLIESLCFQAEGLIEYFQLYSPKNRVHLIYFNSLP